MKEEKVVLYKHNKKAYEKILKHFEKTNRTCVIHPTGSGKSILSIKFIEDNINNNILLLAPTYTILDQFNKNIAKHIMELDISNLKQEEINTIVAQKYPNIKFSIYSNVGKIKEEKFDNIIMDEFHRVGADEWGRNVNELLNNNEDSKVLGVSATPIRYLDDNRDMSKEIFNGDVASEITLAEAILKGILPTPQYVSALYSFDEDIKDIESKIEKYKDKSKIKELTDLLNQAKKKIQNSEGLDDIFLKNIKNKNGKFIVFCRDIAHMMEMEEKCLEWFKKTNPNIEISDVHSKKGKELNQYYIEYFENNEKKTLKLLFSVEMLNEGLHVKNIDGVIMFRPTSSPIIYMQQLGRALSVGHNSHPLVFDIVNNSTSLESVLDIKKDINDMIKQIIHDRENGIDNHEDYESNDELLKILDSFKIIEEQKDIIDTLKTLKEEATYTWEDWYNLAKAYYDCHGDLDVLYSFKTINGYDYDENGVCLGNWIALQRRIYQGKEKGTLSNEQKELLDAIGMRWENIDLMEQWMMYYKLAKVYYEEYGNLEIPTNFKTIDGIHEVKEEDPNFDKALNLGFWLIRQRQSYKGNKGGGILTVEQRELLDAIGMRWENIDLMEQWMVYYKLAKAYFEEYGNLEISTDFKTIDGIHEVKEEDPNYDKALNLYYWITRQRRIYQGKEKGTLSNEQKELLDAIGMRWENIDLMEQWMVYYKLAKAYFEDHGNLKIPKNFKTIDGIHEVKKENPNYEKAIDLGSWLYRQKLIYKGQKDSYLSEYKIKLLEEIGIIWFSDKIDDNLQKTIITEDNKLKKEKEIMSRFKSLMSKYDGDSLPSKEELDDAFMDQLNRKK